MSYLISNSSVMCLLNYLYYNVLFTVLLLLLNEYINYKVIFLLYKLLMFIYIMTDHMTITNSLQVTSYTTYYVTACNNRHVMRTLFLIHKGCFVSSECKY